MGKLVQRAGRYQGWEYQETMAAGVNSNLIPIPPLREGTSVSVTLVIDSGEGKVQFTTSGDANLSSAVWQDWPEGVCIETTSDILLSAVSGLRLVRASGVVGIEIVI